MSNHLEQQLKGLWALAVVALLLLSLLGAFSRLGWPLPAAIAPLATQHGALMICGFFGTLIGLERWILKRFVLGYVSPFLTISGSLALFLFSESFAAVCFLLAAMYQIGAFAWSKQAHHLPTLIQLLGLAVWGGGCLVWALGRGFTDLSLAWIGFLSLTILGSRLDKIQKANTAMARPSRLEYRILLGSMLCFAVGCLLNLMSQELSYQLCGASFLVSALWYLIFDAAVLPPERQAFLSYFRWGLKLSYGWLWLTGILLLIWGSALPLLAYDVYLHMILLGFVFGMVFSHLPIMLPELSGLQFRFHNILFAPLFVLHAGLAIRFGVVVFQQHAFFPWFGLINVLALVSLPVTLMLLRVSKKKSPSVESFN